MLFCYTHHDPSACGLPAFSLAPVFLVEADALFNGDGFESWENVSAVP